MKRLEGKVAIITGSTSGIGSATATLFAQEGAKVIVTGRREELGKKVVDQIKSDGGEATYIQMDASSEESIKHAIDQTLEIYGTIDVLVNNVGGGKNGPLHTLSSEDFDHVVAVDLKSYFLAMKYVLPIMIEKKSGSIINVSSTAVHAVPPTTSLYQMCKMGINGLTRVVAKEYAEYGIRCNVVAPGYTDTDIFTALDEKGKAAMAQTIPMKRLGNPVEIAYPILFFASDESSYCSGRVLDANGAWGL